MSLLKQASRDCAAAAAERLDEAQQTDEAQVLSELALAAIGKLGDLLGDDEATHELRRELKRVARQLKAVVPQVQAAVASNSASAESASAAEQQDAAAKKAADAAAKLDLGQYSNVEVFDGDGKKQTKFARLMGGAKKAARVDDGSHEHATFALSAAEEKKRDKEIEYEFDAARTHQGKKGLGAR